eukprot:943070-Pelagomonas_calceolata.AAC.2
MPLVLVRGVHPGELNLEPSTFTALCCCVVVSAAGPVATFRNHCVQQDNFSGLFRNRRCVAQMAAVASLFSSIVLVASGSEANQNRF